MIVIQFKILPFAKMTLLLYKDSRSQVQGTGQQNAPSKSCNSKAPLVTYLIFHLSVTHIGRTEERQMASIKQMRGGFFSLFFIRDKPRID